MIEVLVATWFAVLRAFFFFWNSTHNNNTKIGAKFLGDLCFEIFSNMENQRFEKNKTKSTSPVGVVSVFVM